MAGASLVPIQAKTHPAEAGQGWPQAIAQRRESALDGFLVGVIMQARDREGVEDLIRTAVPHRRR